MNMNRFKDRCEAGKIVAKHLQGYANRSDVIVLGLPRGGVPVAYEIAQALHVPLDVYIVRKLGVPGQPELAMGAIAVGNARVLNDDIIRQLAIPQTAIESVAQSELAELKRREVAYRGNKSFPDLANKIIILVDDGIATGATMRAAVKSLRESKPAKIIIAVPVAEVKTCKNMVTIADEVVCPLQPSNFYAVGAWYEHFDQTSDEEVKALLQFR